MSLIRDIYDRRELLWLLVVRNLKIRYKNSALGFFWSLLVPLMMIAVYAVFAGILKFNKGQPQYLQFLVVGIVVWQYTAMCLNDGLYAILGNSNLVKKASFPRIILPLSMTSANLVNFLLTMVVLILYLLFAGMNVQHIYLLPVAILVQTALCLGMSLVIATSNVFFRDTEHILGVFTLAWFFLSPIFYEPAMQVDQILTRLGPQWTWLVFLNPMTGIVCIYRSVLMSRAIPSMLGVCVSVTVSLAVCILGIAVFNRFQSKFGEEL